AAQANLAEIVEGLDAMPAMQGNEAWGEWFAQYERYQELVAGMGDLNAETIGSIDPAVLEEYNVVWPAVLAGVDTLAEHVQADAIRAADHVAELGRSSSTILLVVVGILVLAAAGLGLLLGRQISRP